MMIILLNVTVRNAKRHGTKKRLKKIKKGVDASNPVCIMMPSQRQTTNKPTNEN